MIQSENTAKRRVVNEKISDLPALPGSFPRENWAPPKIRPDAPGLNAVPAKALRGNGLPTLDSGPITPSPSPAPPPPNHSTPPGPSPRYTDATPPPRRPPASSRPGARPGFPRAPRTVPRRPD